MNALLNHLNNPKRILDIGANVGVFSSELHRHFRNCDFMMVEANKNCEEQLKKLPFSYDIVALGSQSGEADFYIENNNLLATGASLKKENTVYYSEGKYFTDKIKVETLDSRCYFGSEIIDLMKLDVQGNELEIMLGGESTLARTDLVLLEVSNMQYNSGAPLFDSVLNYMKIKGFKLIDVIDFVKGETLFGPILIQMDALFKNSNIYN